MNLVDLVRDNQWMSIQRLGRPAGLLLCISVILACQADVAPASDSDDTIRSQLSDVDQQDLIESSSDQSIPFVLSDPEPLTEDVTVDEQIENLVRLSLRKTSSSVTEVRPQRTTPQWLDIRPKLVDTEQVQLVPKHAVPNDESGLVEIDPIATLCNHHASELNLRDFYRGATFCHRPLYFEDRSLERFGSIGCALKQCPPVHATLHFGFSVLALPAKAVIRRPWNHVPSGS